MTNALSHRPLVVRLMAVVLGMFAFGYALVPLYEVFCEVTGVNGKTGRTTAQAVASARIDAGRIVKVQFVATVNNELPWRFEPIVKSVTVHPGALTEVEFLAENLSREERSGQAVPSVAPGEASRYFAKTECFCFTAQKLAGGEGRRMPVRFIVDTRLPAHIRELTLSYTFFSIEPDTPALAARSS